MEVASALWPGAAPPAGRLQNGQRTFLSDTPPAGQGKPTGALKMQQGPRAHARGPCRTP